MRRKNKLTRVDLQVSTLIIILLFCSGLIVAVLTSQINLRAFRNHLKMEADMLNNYIFESDLPILLQQAAEDVSILQITSDQNLNIQAVQQQLFHTTQSSTVQRIYLVAQDNNDYKIYAGLEKDFSNDISEVSANTKSISGQGINWQSEAHINKAITGKSFISADIMRVNDKHLIGFYYPVYDLQGSVISVLALEFSAQQVYLANNAVFFCIIIVFLLSCAISILFSVHRFRAISNLAHKTVYNIDRMTGFKSRNTFDLDLNNINSTKAYESLTIYYIDLNDLKQVNDSRGHEHGDDYIIAMSEIIKDSAGAGDIIYRVGGDEFCILSFNHVRSKARAMVKRMEANTRAYNSEHGTDYSAAIGFAIFNYDLDSDAGTTRIRAEMNMYENKKRMKNGLDQIAEEGFMTETEQRARQWQQVTEKND